MNKGNVSENHLLSFLSKAKEYSEEIRLRGTEKVQPIHVVLGNQACDLDSAVSAIVLAYHHQKSANPSTPGCYIPVLNISESDVRHRGDITHIFNLLHVPLELLVFRSSLDLIALGATSDLSLHLVDHNELPSADAELCACVVEIMDHHKDSGSFSLPVDSKVVKSVGSCSTLVSMLVLESSIRSEVLLYPVPELLLATILLDSVQLDRASGRCTEMDECIAGTLTKMSLVDTQLLYNTAFKGKMDVSHLDTATLLSKDSKDVADSKSKFPVMFASVMLSLTELSQRPDFETELASLQADINKGYKSVFVLSTSYDTDGRVCRELVLSSLDPDLLKQLGRAVLTWEGVDACEPSLLSAKTFLYRLGNCQVSRKVLLPLLRQCLEDLLISHAQEEPTSFDDDSSTRLILTQSSDVSTQRSSPMLVPSAQHQSQDDPSTSGGRHGDYIKVPCGGSDNVSRDSLEFMDAGILDHLLERPRIPSENISMLGLISEDRSHRGSIHWRNPAPNMSSYLSETSSGTSELSMACGGYPVASLSSLNNFLDTTEDQEDDSNMSNASVVSLSSVLGRIGDPAADSGHYHGSLSALEESITLSYCGAVIATAEDMDYLTVCVLSEHGAETDVAAPLSPYLRSIYCGGHYGRSSIILVCSFSELPASSNLQLHSILNHLCRYAAQVVRLSSAERYSLVMFDGTHDEISKAAWLTRCDVLLNMKRIGHWLEAVYVVSPSKRLKCDMFTYVSNEFFALVHFLPSTVELQQHLSTEFIAIPHHIHNKQRRTQERLRKWRLAFLHI